MQLSCRFRLAGRVLPDQLEHCRLAQPQERWSAFAGEASVARLQMAAICSAGPRQAGASNCGRSDAAWALAHPRLQRRPAGTRSPHDQRDLAGTDVWYLASELALGVAAMIGRQAQACSIRLRSGR